MRPEGKIGIGIGLAAGALAFVMVRAGVFSQSPPPSGSERNDPAPELAGIAGWINSEPLTIEGLRGTVVLLDFWTYSCVNCVRTFPFLRALHENYGAHGFQIIGVHSPEFEFEKDPGRVRAEATRHRLAWPIALDNDMETWRSYRNRFWPRVYLIDREGRIRFDHAGEGGEDLIEARIRGALAEPGGALPEPLNFAGRDFPGGLTPEVYLGWRRGLPAQTVANPEGFRPGTAFTYPAQPPERVRGIGTSGQVFLAGRWRAEPEFLSAGAAGARIDLPFRARDVYVVAGARSPVGVTVLLDGKPIASPGADVRGGGLRVGSHGLYHVARLPAMGTHVLALQAVAAGVAFYTFTFG